MLKKNEKHLLELKFELFGEWELNGSKLNFKTFNVNAHILSDKRVLYAFVVKKRKSSDLVYIGKTMMGIKARFQGYINAHSSQLTNFRIKDNVIREVLGKKHVLIYCFSSFGNLQWHGYDIDLVAGLEYSLVSELSPIWNIHGKGKKLISESEILEIESARVKKVLAKSSARPIIKIPVKLQSAYFNKGFFNIPKNFDHHFPRTGEIVLMLSKGYSLRAKIDRNSNKSKTVRLNFGKELATWFSQNFELLDIVWICVFSGNKISIRK